MDDFLVSAFRDLCDREGGYKAVAARINANDQSLYQVYSGVKLPSGNPKGVGPKLRKALDEAYPGWSSSRIEQERYQFAVLTAALKARGWQVHMNAKVGDYLALLEPRLNLNPRYRIDMLLVTPDQRGIVVELRPHNRDISNNVLLLWRAFPDAFLVVQDSSDLLRALKANPRTAPFLTDIDLSSFTPEPGAVMETPVAHLLSYQKETVSSVPWGELEMQRDKLPKAFWVTLEDDGLAPRAPIGTKVKFERRAPHWGDAVLIRDASGKYHARVYRQNLDHGWEGVAPSGFLATFHGGMPGVAVVAVLDAIAGGWAQLSR